MNEIKTAVDMIDIHNYTYMTNGTSRTRTGKKHEVAALKVVLHNRLTLTVLVARRTIELNVQFSIDITCKSGTIEGVWSRLSRAVTCPYVRESFIKHIVYSCNVIVIISIASAIKKVIITNFIIFAVIVIVVIRHGKDRRYENEKQQYENSKYFIIHHNRLKYLLYLT